MFGARGPLLEDEKDKAGGGQPPPPKDEKPKDEKPKDPPKDEPKTFTEDQLEDIVQERLARDRRARGVKHQPEPPAKKSKQADNADDSTWVFDFTDAFDAAVDERGVKPTRGLKAKMRTAYQAERPEDPDAWVSSWLDDVGLKKSSTPPSQTQQPKEGEKPPVPPKPNGSGPGVSDKGGAGGAPVDFETKLSEDPLGITDADIKKLYEKHGEEKANHLIRKAVDRKLETVKLVADPRRIRK
jgi:hypothetical protein